MLRRCLAAATFVVAAAGAAPGGGGVLAVQDIGRAHVLHREPVAPGATFVLRYVHSSENVPVRGTFRIEPDRTLRIVETAFAGFGPGLPALAPGDDWNFADGMIVYRPRTGRLTELTVRVSPITRHRLSLPSGRDLDLSALMGPGGAVRVSVE